MRALAIAAVSVLLAVASSPARAACDPGGVDAVAVAAGRAAIDDACPCASAVSRSTYRRCVGSPGTELEFAL